MPRIDVITITTEDFKLGLVSDNKRIQLAKDVITAHAGEQWGDQEILNLAANNGIRVCVLEKYKEDSVIVERINYVLGKKNLIINEDTYEVALFLMDPDAFAKQVGVPKEELMTEEAMKEAYKELLD